MEEGKSRKIDFDRIKEVQSLQRRKNHLLLIAINEYNSNEFSALNNCVKDVEDIADLLLEKYEFEPENVSRLYNENANRKNIFDKLRSYAANLGSEDSLVIYFAGHGDEDDVLEEGYWIPQDGKRNERHDWLDNTRLVGILEKIKAHHILLLVDSCFSGTLFFHAKSSASRYDRAPSRYVITSGSKELVSDGKPGTNSPFAKGIIDFLKDSDQTAIKASDLSHHLKNIPFKHQTPNGSAIMMEGHKNGEFVFYKKGVPRIELDNSLIEKEKNRGGSSRNSNRERQDLAPPVASKTKKILFFSLFLLLLSSVIYASFRTPPTMDLEFEVACSNVSFEYIDGATLFTNLRNEEIQIYPLEFVRIPINEGVLSLNNESKKFQSPRGILLKEDELFGNGIALIEKAELVNLNFPQGSKLTMGMIETAEDLIGLEINLNTLNPVDVLLNPFNELKVELGDMAIIGIPEIDSSEIYGQIKIKAENPEGNVYLQGKTGNTSLTLLSKNTENLKSEGITGRNLSFRKADKTINGGKRSLSSIRYAKSTYYYEGEVFDSLNIDTNEDFLWKEQTIFEIKELQITEEYIFLKGRSSISKEEVINKGLIHYPNNLELLFWQKPLLGVSLTFFFILIQGFLIRLIIKKY